MPKLPKIEADWSAWRTWGDEEWNALFVKAVAAGYERPVEAIPFHVQHAIRREFNNRKAEFAQAEEADTRSVLRWLTGEAGVDAAMDRAEATFLRLPPQDRAAFTAPDGGMHMGPTMFENLLAMADTGYVDAAAPVPETPGATVPHSITPTPEAALDPKLERDLLFASKHPTYGDAYWNRSNVLHERAVERMTQIFEAEHGTAPVGGAASAEAAP